MKGSIRPKGAGHEMRVYLGHDPVTNKPRYRSRMTNVQGTRALDDALRKFIAECEADPIVTTAGTFGHLYETWLGSIAQSHKASTMLRYRSNARVHILPALGDIPLNKLTARHIDDLTTGMLRKGLSGKTARQAYANVHTALGQGLRWGLVASNVADGANRPRITKPVHTIPDIVQASEAIQEYASKDPDMVTAWWVLASTGGRRGEGFGLRWSDVDLIQGTLHIHRAIVLGVETDTKTHADRHVEIDRTTVEMLAMHRQRCDERALTAGIELQHDAFVFSPDASGRRHVKDTNTASKTWGRWAGQLKEDGTPRWPALVGVPLKNLRHMAATALLANGVPLPTVSKRLGHERTSTTADIYAGALPGYGRQAADVMDRLMGGRPNPLPELEEGDEEED